jgi:CopA family copper-resistance protein
LLSIILQDQFMSNDRRPPPVVANKVSRRQFVTGAAAGGLLLATGLPARASAAGDRVGPTVLSGNSFDLGIGYREVNFTGTPRQATVVNGGLPGPVLRWQQGEEVVLRVTNNLAVDSSIHWHGIILPSNMDGVPGFSFPGIKPGETFTYRYPVTQSGTYWYHSHSGFQEQTGLYGALIIDPIEPEPISYDRDYVVMLSDWSDTKPERIFNNLKKLGHYYNYQQRTFGDFTREVGEEGWGNTLQDRAMWWRMRMSDRDISDVTGYTYTFLTNGMTPDDNWTGLFARGERIRLRFINGSAMTNFDVRIPGLKMTVVAADGQYVEPVSVDEFRIGVAETYDVIVEPQEGAYTIFSQAIDRSGYARGTLTEQAGMTAEVPALDPPVILSHADMGMGHDMGHDMSSGMDHSQMDHGEQPSAPTDHAGMDHSQHAGPSMLGKAGLGSDAPVIHAATEQGFQVDMRAESPRDQLDNPGIGLHGNGRRVLTYADLRNLNPTPDPREPEREIQLHLTGNMTRYMWSMDGIRFSDAEPLPLTLHERVRITLVNDTMMNHPIHLHGMWSDLETGSADHIPRKHTILVQPGSKVSYLVTPDMPGDWAYHCHLLYHMMGMFRRVRVSAGRG